MGGEHDAHFEGQASEQEQATWMTLKLDILAFIDLNIEKEEQGIKYGYAHFCINELDELQKIREAIAMITDVSKLSLDWGSRACLGRSGTVLHDITHLLMLNFPGKIHVSFERCFSGGISPNRDWEGPHVFTHVEETGYQFALYGKDL